MSKAEPGYLNISNSHTSLGHRSYNDSQVTSDYSILPFERVLCQSISLLIENTMNTYKTLDQLQKDLKEAVDEKQSVDGILLNFSRLSKQFDITWSTKFLKNFNTVFQKEKAADCKFTEDGQLCFTKTYEPFVRFIMARS